ncbi:MAG: hypothetical protein AUJ34_01330 [Parcubacteria group bacterium CG1_02_41_12]|nr:MAG: hypothetical protein AUJ34_01330 [Parcubacteria group bacterium CG1_02_41_12]PIQ79396.1 MAG: hypothetical protein COV79_03785 [Parcubacteria group bacterium CG11_big_fil_rev_8_21_14_0_20_41_14]PIR57536.1 MAG: hypothetical protein COU72_00500 [Parcubacteria group bacterium CG10_big_fil_rev_8_21_14_0_10_41_35]PIZ81309.1 MAG: hypothetical protein COY02_02735 [Parcubacteria group bacterium CG_4_10_14_0_2_um_filter_41_6]
MILYKLVARGILGIAMILCHAINSIWILTCYIQALFAYEQACQRLDWLYDRMVLFIYYLEKILLKNRFIVR